MKNILFPTDFSETSLNSKDFCIEIAKRSGAKIHLLNIYNVTIYDPNMPAELMMESMNEAMRFSKEGLEKLLPDFKSQTYNNGGNLEVEIVSKQGLVSDEIEIFVSENNIDLIVMGTTGESGFLDKIMGSNTSSVIEKVKCPVLAIPAKAKYKGISNIVYAASLTDDDRSEVPYITEIATLFDAEIKYLHICDDDDLNMISQKDSIFETLKEEINYSKIGFELLENNDIVKGLESYVNNNKVDILVMAQHKRNFFERIFKSSKTETMVHHTDIPLYALHIRK